MHRIKQSIKIHWRRLARSSVRLVLLLALLIATTLACITPNSAGAPDERVTVRLDGREMFRVSAVENVDATARARQIERRMSRLCRRLNGRKPNQTSRLLCRP